MEVRTMSVLILAATLAVTVTTVGVSAAERDLKPNTVDRIAEDMELNAKDISYILIYARGNVFLGQGNVESVEVRDTEGNLVLDVDSKPVRNGAPVPLICQPYS